MVLDQVSDATVRWRLREEEGKLRGGIKSGRGRRGDGTVAGQKRKRDDGDEDGNSDEEGLDDGEKEVGDVKKKPKKKTYGPKGPNPLSVKKKVKVSMPPRSRSDQNSKKDRNVGVGIIESSEGEKQTKAKRKRKRRQGGGSADGEGEGEGEVQAGSREVVDVDMED